MKSLLSAVLLSSLFGATLAALPTPNAAQAATGDRLTQEAGYNCGWGHHDRDDHRYSPKCHAR